MITHKCMVGLLAATFGLAMPALIGGAHAYQCKTQPEAAAMTAADSGSALSAARSLWTSKDRTRHGLAWSVWPIAAGQAQYCNAVGGGKYNCEVTAKPCLYVVP